MKQITFDKVKLGGFWKSRNDINKSATISTIYDRFSDTGRFDSLKCEWQEGMPHKPHIFWDSDVAKWIEAAAYSIQMEPDKDLEAKIDEAVDNLAAHQWEDGYINTYYTVVEPANRFTNRDNHELYCAGHLLEAAVAYYNATGKDKLLNIMKKYIDYIEKRFIIEDSALFNTPGHEEIELALIKLYNLTHEKKYLDMCKHFIDKRGTTEKDDKQKRNWIGHDYDQTHLPVRQQREAVGHSVRALYLYCGMADLALETGDKELFDACDALFDSAVFRRMYITGGVGATAHGERFADDFILPNDVAYAETCASIALAFFARRMSNIEPDSKYADAAEITIYNNSLAGVSLDGHSFFYVNPLEINLDRHNASKKFFESRANLLTQRIEVFDCSCCPPNISRMIASIGDFLYSMDDTTVYAHHYMESEAEFDGIKIKQETRYPAHGGVRFTVSGMKGKKLAVRIPAWSSYTSLNGEMLSADIKKGYAYLDVTEDEQVFDFYFEMKTRLVCANPMVDSDNGRVAVCRGPVVYCAESVLNDGIKLNTLSIKTPLEAGTQWDGSINGYKVIVKVNEDKPCNELYKNYDPADVTEREITMLPYYAFANNGESDMLIWFRHD